MVEMETAASTPRTRAAALAEHYQKTIELVSHYWERRNRQFIILTSVLAAATFVTIVQRPLIVAFKHLIANYLNVTGDERKLIEESLPLAFDLIVAFLVVAVFYLMASLYHRSGVIINNYQYLGRLEREIRSDLQVPEDWIAFSREGKFYRITSLRMTRLIRSAYKVVLGSLLVLFFASRLLVDLPQEWIALRLPDRNDLLSWASWAGKHFLFVLDVLVSFLTTLVFLAYATLSPRSELETQ